MDANLKYIFFLNLAYPLDCLHVPPGVRVPPVENHWRRGYTQRRHSVSCEVFKEADLWARRKIRTPEGRAQECALTDLAAFQA